MKRLLAMILSLTLLCGMFTALSASAAVNTDLAGTGTDSIEEDGMILPTPQITSIENVFLGIKLSWIKTEGAELYRVYRKSSTTSWEAVGDTASGSFTDLSTELYDGNKYTYCVQSMTADGLHATSYHNNNITVRYIKTPVIDSITNLNGGQKIKWTSVESADKYMLYIRTTTKWKRIATVSGTSYTYQGVTDNTENTYTVAALSGNVKSGYDKAGTTVKYIAPPEIKSLTNIPNGVRISWKATSDAAEFRVYRSIGSYKNWTKITDTASCKFDDTSLKKKYNGKKVFYTVRAIGKYGRFNTYYQQKGWSIVYVTAPTQMTFTAAQDGSVTLNWGKVDGAVRYLLYRKEENGPKWKTIAKTKQPTYSDTADLSSGVTYLYTVKAVDKNGNVSGYQTAGWSNQYIATPTKLKATNTLSGVRVSWASSKGAAYYLVFRKDPGSKKWKGVGVTNSKTTQYVDGTPSNLKTYSYTVRCVKYVTENGKKVRVYTSGYNKTGVSKKVVKADSPLVNVVHFNSHHSGERIYPLTRVSVHCTAMICTAKSLGDWFARPDIEASSNYGIGNDGSVGQYLPESYRSWCTSSYDNDNRAITIEVGSEEVDPFKVTNTAYNKLLDLLTDICKRNGKKKLVWLGDKDKSFNYVPKSDELLMTVHRWFEPRKSCPGPYLYALHPKIAAEVNKRLAAG